MPNKEKIAPIAEEPISFWKKYQFVFISMGIFISSVAGLLVISLTLSVFSGLGLAGDRMKVSAVNFASADQTPVQKEKVWSVENKGIAAPEFSGEGVLAKDLQTGENLYQKNIHEKLRPASTTKVLTALTAMDHYRDGDLLVVSKESLVGGSTMGLSAGEELSFRAILYGMLLNSGNDAAFVLADNYPGGRDKFIEAMNVKAASLGLSDSHFANPAGFDSDDHYSSAYDLGVIASEAIKNEQLAKIVATKQASVGGYEGGKIHNLNNLNQLLGEDGVIGIKTGFTSLAGENLVGLVDHDGHRVLTVVLGSRDRFGDTRNLIDWVFSNFSWKFE